MGRSEKMNKQEILEQIKELKNKIAMYERIQDWNITYNATDANIHFNLKDMIEECRKELKMLRRKLKAIQ